jgi:hypothetical protein
MSAPTSPGEPLFLTLDEVLELHSQQIDMYGGSHGLRDPGALSPPWLRRKPPSAANTFTAPSG